MFYTHLFTNMYLIQLLVICNTTKKNYKELQAHCLTLWKPSSLATRSCYISQMLFQITLFFLFPSSKIVPHIHADLLSRARSVVMRTGLNMDRTVCVQVWRIGQTQTYYIINMIICSFIKLVLLYSKCSH
jgi:hypothetical protein